MPATADVGVPRCGSTALELVDDEQRLRRASARRGTRAGVRAPMRGVARQREAAHRVARRRAGSSAGTRLGSARSRCAQRGRERAAGRPLADADGDAGDAAQRARGATWSGIDGDQRRACTGGAGAARTASAGPCSTIRPAYMTAIAVGDLRDDREVVGDVDHRDARLAAQALDLVEDHAPA